MMLFVSLLVVILVDVMVMLGSRQPQENFHGLDLLGLAASCSLLLAMLTAFVALCLCIAVPSESGARKHAIGAVALTAAALLVVVIGTFVVVRFATNDILGQVDAIQRRIEVKQPREVFRSMLLGLTVVSIAGNLLYFGALMFFCRFLRGVTIVFGKLELADKLGWLVWACVFTLILNSGLQVTGFLAGDLMTSQVPSLMVNVLWLALMALFAWAVSQVYGAIQPADLPPPSLACEFMP